MAKKIMAGGYRAPFEPFVDPVAGGSGIVSADYNGLQLGVTKLASKNKHAWVAGASWQQPEPDPEAPPPEEPLPSIAGGAVAWIPANSTAWDSKVWDGTPLAEDPRPEESKKSWGAFKPKWHDHGLFIGTEIFPKEETETNGDPSLVSELEIDISPGFVAFKTPTSGLDPQLLFLNAIAGQYQNTDGCFIDAGLSPGYGTYSGDFGVYATRAPFPPFYGFCFISGGTIEINRFYPGQTVTQVQAISDRPTPLKPNEEAVVGDRVGALSYQIFYQNARAAQESCYNDGGDLICEYESALPAGTWEIWTFSSVSTIQSMNYSTTNGYGLVVSGQVGEGPSSKTGKIHQLLWSYGEPTLLEGTWRYEEERIRRGEESKPDGAPPGPGSVPVSGGGGGGGGWPSERDRRTREGQFFNTATINFPSYSNLYGETMTVPVTWTLGVRNVTYQGLRSESVTGYTYTVQYDTRKGGPPRWLLQTTPNVSITYREYAPYAVVPLYEGVGHVLVGAVPPCQVTSWTTNFATGGLVNLGPVSSCTAIGEYYYGNLVTSTVTRSTPYLDPARAPIESPPDPNGGSPVPGSGIPGSPFPPELGDPGLGVPNLTPAFPGAAPNSDWVEVLAVEQEYELMAAVGETLRARRWYFEKREDGLIYQARWSLQSIIESGEVSSLELEYEIPFPLVFRSPTNSEDTYPEEALYLVEYRVQADWDALPPEVQAEQEWTERKVFYLKDNGSEIELPTPVEVDAAIFDFLPEIGLAAPDQYRFERNLVLSRGILYIIPPPEAETDYRASAATLNLTAYRVDDGSFSAVTGKTAKISSLVAGNAVIDDASFQPSLPPPPPTP